MRERLALLMIWMTWATTGMASPADDLLEAARNGQTEQVQMLLDQGVDVNAADKSGTTALMRAAVNADADMVAALLSRKADVNLKDASGKTALMACWSIPQHDSAYPAVMQLLIAGGADVNVRDSYVINAFLLAVVSGDLDVVQPLLAKGMDVNLVGQVRIPGVSRKKKKAKKEHVALTGNDEEINKEREATPLLLAALAGRPEVLQILLAHHAQVDAQDEYGRTPLMLAAENGDPDVVRILIAAKANVNAQSNDNSTALILALQHNHPDVADLLHTAGAHVDARNAGGMTALMQAAGQGNLDVVQKLIGYGADVNLKANSGTTALMLAIKNGHPDLIRVFIAGNANVNAKDNEGVAALAMLPPENAGARALLIAAGAVSAAKNVNWQGVWKGQLGTQEITACFQLDEGRLYQLGVYYYARHRQLIQLDMDKDSVQAETDMMLHETSGAWRLTLKDENTLAGTWTYQDRHFPIELVRVPFVNPDDAAVPCNSAEFNNGRKTPPQFVRNAATLDGTKYLVVTNKKDARIASFELIGTDPNIDRVNQQLHKDLLATIDDAFECSSGVAGRSENQTDFSSSATPLLITKHWLVAALHIDEYCGGAHPDSGTSYRVWDLTAGQPEDVWTWFNEKGAGKENDVVTPGPALEKLLTRLWPKGSDAECPDSPQLVSWTLHPERDGLVFSPELPHVIQACAEDIRVPYRALAPMLNTRGKAAVAALLSDLAAQSASHK